MDAKLIALPLAALATWQIVEVLHHAKITLPIRHWAQCNIKADVGWRRWLADLLQCAFCLSHWAAALCWSPSVLSNPWCWESWLWYLPGVFATARLANLGNDLAYDRSRSPKYELPDMEEPDATRPAEGCADATDPTDDPEPNPGDSSRETWSLPDVRTTSDPDHQSLDRSTLPTDS